MIATIAICAACVLVGFTIGSLLNLNSASNLRQKLAREAKIRCVDGDYDNIKNFCNKWVEELDEESLNMLLSKMEEVKADKAIFETFSNDEITKKRIDDAIVNFKPIPHVIAEDVEEMEKPPKKRKRK